MSDAVNHVDVRGLEISIAPMTGKEMATIRRDLHLTGRDLALLTGRNGTTISRYEHGHALIPREMAVLMRTLDSLVWGFRHTGGGNEDD